MFVRVLVLLSLASLAISSPAYHHLLFTLQYHGHWSSNVSISWSSPVQEPQVLIQAAHHSHPHKAAPSLATGAPKPPPMFPCATPPIHVLGLNVTEPVLFPLTIAGVIIGFGYSWILLFPSHSNEKSLLQDNSRISYAFVFFSFGIMNFSGLFLHCFLPAFQNMLLFGTALLMDGFGTSMVGFSLVVAGLTDLGVIKDNSKLKLGAQVVISLALLCGWYATTFMNFKNGFYLLYLLVTVVGSCSYFVLQVIYGFKYGFTRAYWILLSSFVILLVGLSTFYYPSVINYLCSHVPHYVAGEVPWFFASDVSMFLVWVFYTTRNSSHTVNYSSLPMTIPK